MPKRLTDGERSSIRELKVAGKKIKDIAKEVGRDRHTVGEYLRTVSVGPQEVRHELLLAEFRRHFDELRRFARTLKWWLRGVPGPVGGPAPAPQLSGEPPGGGLLGLPGEGRPLHVAGGWRRLYSPERRDEYLLKALMGHTRGAPLWKHWHDWEVRTAAYRKASSGLKQALFAKPDSLLAQGVRPEDVDILLWWLFGVAILKARGVHTTTTPASQGEDFLDRVKDVAGLLADAEQMHELAGVAEADADLTRHQADLHDLAEKINGELDLIGLRGVSAGTCRLCPDVA